MNVSKSLFSAGVITAVAVGSIGAVSAVNAQNAQSSGNRDALIDRISTDTGAERATVEASFEAHREERMAEREAAKEAHFDELVADGTLTQEQRDSLEQKFTELKAEKDALKDQDLSREEVRAAMEEAREELEAWAEAEGIDLDDIKPERGEGRRGHGRHGSHNDDDSTEEIDSSEV